MPRLAALALCCAALCRAAASAPGPAGEPGLAEDDFRSDEECVAAGEECGLSLRQLRGERLREGEALQGKEELQRQEQEADKEQEANEESGAAADPDFEPIAWCTSGGGVRAMVTAIGFANAFAKAGLFSSGELTDVASNSGGSWFLTQFAYNGDFFNSVIGSSPEALHGFVERLVLAYNDKLSFGKKASNKLLELVSKALRVVGTYGTTLDQAITLAEWVLGTGWTNWEEIIDTMLASTPGLGSSTHYQDTMANAQSRSGLQGPTLHFQTSEVTTAYHDHRFLDVHVDFENVFMFDGQGHALSVDQGEDGSRTDMPVIPIQYVVRGSEGHDSQLSEGFQAPESTVYRYRVAEIGRTADPFTLVRSVDFSSEAGHVEPAPEMLGQAPVSTVASASSAAVGMFASPLMLSEMVRNKVGDVAWEGCGELCGDTGIRDMTPGPFNDFGICSRSAVSADHCPYPSRRFIDGGYVDNVATAQTVGLMQKKFGGRRRLRLILSLSSQNPLTHDKPDFSGLADLMQHKDVKPGQLYQGPMFYNVASQQVFDTVWDNLSWNDLSSEFQGDNGLKWASASGMTVDNPAFGVTAGTPVSLLLLAFSSNLANMDDGYSKEYAEVSSSIAESSVHSVVEDWMQRQ